MAGWSSRSIFFLRRQSLSGNVNPLLRHGKWNFNLKNLQKALYSTTDLPYEPEESQVVYQNGYPTVTVMLPSRDEKCLFTMKAHTDTVERFLSMVSEEDKGIERIAIYKQDGTKVAKATTIQMLLLEDFDLVINDRKFGIKSPALDMNSSDQHGVEQVKELIGQLYTSMNLSHWQSQREKDIQLQIESLRHELEPYEQLKEELREAAQVRSNRLTWAGLGLMGVQFGFLARLTWWEYSWDIMEPVTYFVTYGTSIVMFAYYVLTKQEFVYPDVKNRLERLHFHKKAKRKQYDLEHYNKMMSDLHEAEICLKQLKKPLELSAPSGGNK